MGAPVEQHDDFSAHGGAHALFGASTDTLALAAAVALPPDVDAQTASHTELSVSPDTLSPGSAGSPPLRRPSVDQGMQGMYGGMAAPAPDYAYGYGYAECFVGPDGKIHGAHQQHGQHGHSGQHGQQHVDFVSTLPYPT